MKRKLILLVLLSIANNVFAQSERLQYNTGNFHVTKAAYNVLFKPFVRQVGLSYEHKLNSAFSMRAGYIRWFTLNQFSSFRPTHGNGYTEYYNPYSDYAVGEVSNRFNYQMLELSGIYQNKFCKRHSFFGAIGISYSCGKYDELISAYRAPGYSDWLLEYETKKGQHLGLVGELGYNYFLCDNRINIGVSEAVRVYPNLPAQLYLNINIGYNFNWTKKK